MNNFNIKITPVVTINAPTIQLAYQLEALTPAHARHAIQDNFVKHVKYFPYLQKMFTLLIKELNILDNPCCNNQCQSGSTCVAVGTSYTCTCPTCYSGQFCQTCKKNFLKFFEKFLLIKFLFSESML